MNVHQTIRKGLKELLFFNDYLVIPGFGGFVLKKVPAHFSPGNTLLLPSAKQVGFNSQLRQNDGVFVHWLQQELNCTAAEALAHLSDFAGYCTSLLQNRGRINIDGIGFFYLDFENNTCFEPQQHTNFLRDSFGLSPVHVKELELETPEPAKLVFSNRLPLEKELPAEVKKQRNYRKLAIAAVTGAVIFSGLLLVLSTAKISGPLKSAVFGNEAKAVYSPVNYPELSLKNISSDKKDYVADANGIASLELDNKTIAVQAIETMQPEGQSNHMASHVHSSHKNFEVVLGCFSILNNAHKMVNKLSHEKIAAAVSGQNEKGLYVVSSGSYNTKEEALAGLSEIKSAYPNAWIKKAE